MPRSAGQAVALVFRERLSSITILNPLRTAFLIATILSVLLLWVSCRLIQLSMEPLWDGYGSWRLVKVDFSPETQEQLRKQLGREEGVFSEPKFERNWNWILRNIDNGHYTFFIGHVVNGCVPEQRDSMELWPDRVAFRTGCNTCSGCAEVRDGMLTMEWPLCTRIGCDIDEAIFYDLTGPLPIRLVSDTLVIGSSETRCIYYLLRGT